MRLVLAVVCFLILGCDAPSQRIASESGPIKFDDYCFIEGATPALRQTYIVIDEASVVPITDPSEFSESNSLVRDLVMAFADPKSAVASGRAAPLERITITVASSEAPGPRVQFTGCIPALSEADQAKVFGKQSSITSFFTGGKEQEMDVASDQFRTQIAAALIRAASAKRDKPGASADVIGRLSGLGASLRLVDRISRVVIITNKIEKSDFSSISEARAAGFSEARDEKADLGNSEVYVLGSKPETQVAYHYLLTRLLSINGSLAGWDYGVAGLSFSEAPSEIRRYSGSAIYPDGSDQFIQVRIAIDSGGKLVNSWMTLLGLQSRPIPLNGIASCSEKTCDLRSDVSGFAQAWVSERGNDPIFDNTAPFGGMREWRIKLTDRTLSGEVFDSAVGQVGEVKGKRSIELKGELVGDATF